MLREERERESMVKEGIQLSGCVPSPEWFGRKRIVGRERAISE